MKSQYFSPKEKFESKADGPQHQRDSDHPTRCSTSSIQLSLQNVHRQKSRYLLGGFASFFVFVTSIFSIVTPKETSLSDYSGATLAVPVAPPELGPRPLPSRGRGTCAKPGERHRDMAGADVSRLSCAWTGGI